MGLILKTKFHKFFVRIMCACSCMLLCVCVFLCVLDPRPVLPCDTIRIYGWRGGEVNVILETHFFQPEKFDFLQKLKQNNNFWRR